MFGNCLIVEGTCHFPTCVRLVNDALFHSFAFLEWGFLFIPFIFKDLIVKSPI